jgi:hypothetical protein
MRGECARETVTLSVLAQDSAMSREHRRLEQPFDAPETSVGERTFKTKEADDFTDGGMGANSWSRDLVIRVEEFRNQQWEKQEELHAAPPSWAGVMPQSGLGHDSTQGATPARRRAADGLV